MRAVDTNLIVRIFAEDDPMQAETAERILMADSVFVPKTVVLEFEWVMRSVYHKPTATIAAAIELILATSNVQVEDHAVVARAVSWFKQGMDFADGLHLASSSHANEFVTLDASLRRRASALRAQPPAVSP